MNYRFRSNGPSSDAITGLVIGIVVAYIVRALAISTLGVFSDLFTNQIVLTLGVLYLGGLWYQIRGVV